MLIKPEDNWLKNDIEKLFGFDKMRVYSYLNQPTVFSTTVQDGQIFIWTLSETTNIHQIWLVCEIEEETLNSFELGFMDLLSTFRQPDSQPFLVNQNKDGRFDSLSFELVNDKFYPEHEVYYIYKKDEKYE